MHAHERGQLLPIFGLLLVVLMGMAALGVDVGYWRYQQRIEQAAADSAAIAGADELNYPALADVSVAARNDAAANGFTDDGGATVSVTTSNPPTTGVNSGNAKAVQVVIHAKEAAFFGGGFGLATQWINARSVALVSSATRVCMYALSNSSSAITMNGATINIPNCGIASNGGFTASGSAITASSIGYIGSISDSGSSFPEAQPKVAVPVTDPCPSIPGCAYLTAHPPTSGTCITPTGYYGGSSATIPAGRYCATLQIQGVNTVTFSPGVYEFDGGLNTTGASQISGSGVTFYNGAGTTSIQIQAATINLSAPTTGNTAGVVIFQAFGNTQTFQMDGGGNGLAGLLYFPSANVTGAGASSTWLYLVASTIGVYGNGITVPSAAFPGATTGRATLAE